MRGLRMRFFRGRPKSTNSNMLMDNNQEDQYPVGEPVENKMLNFVWRHLLLMED